MTARVLVVDDLVANIKLLEARLAAEYFEVVTAILSDFPEMREALGPHGIPLVEHARVGGADARAVLELLEATEVSG